MDWCFLSVIRIHEATVAYWAAFCITGRCRKNSFTSETLILRTIRFVVFFIILDSAGCILQFFFV